MLVKQFAQVVGAVLLLSGCALHPVPIADAVGPNPFLAQNPSGKGAVQVFTAKEMETQAWDGFENMRRTGYYIYNDAGKLIAHIGDNNLGKYDSTPAKVPLASGSYHITALMAEDLGEWVSVPVGVKPGVTTEIHLDKNWSPPAYSAETNFVGTNGCWIGWRAKSSR